MQVFVIYECFIVEHEESFRIMSVHSSFDKAEKAIAEYEEKNGDLYYSNSSISNNNDMKNVNENENDNEVSYHDSLTIRSIVDYLIQKANVHYRATVDDFKTVIDKKCAEWLGNPKMEQYLRPETLFGTKFESYLNAKVTPNQTNNRNNAEPPKNSTDEFMNKLQSLYEKDDE